jgi:hypothetical protein
MKNQTEELWLTDSPAADSGTGIFIFPSTQAVEFGVSNWQQPTISEGHGPLQKALVSDMTYLDCVKRGQKDWILAYKWVPESLAPYVTVMASASSCSPVRCVSRCARYGCVCIDGECK